MSFRGATRLIGLWLGNSSSNQEMQVRSQASYSGLPEEERHSTARDPLRQRYGAGMETFTTEVKKKDQVIQQSKGNEKTEQSMAYTCTSNRRDI